MKPIKLVSGIFTVGLWTMLSRVMGLMRDVMIANYLGTGPAYQAFVVAIRLPNMFRRFFAEGAFNTAFIPMFSKRFEREDGAGEFANQAFSGLASVLIVFTLLAQLAMPWFILALASGFSGSETFDLTVVFGRIAFPYILFISLAALASGVLNATGRFAAAAAAPVMLNILLVLAMLGAAIFNLDVAKVLIWTIPIAGVVQLAIVWIAAKRAGFTLRLQRPRYTPEMKALVTVAVPAALATGVMQINLLVGTQVASYFDRAVGWLYYADRLYQLPLGVVGIAVGVVLLPELARRLASEDEAGAKSAFSRANEISLALTLPAAVALVVIPFPLVSVLFERGEFTSDDSAAVAVALTIYGLGLPAFTMQKTLQPLYFARSDTQTPFRFALITMGLNVILAIGLSFVVGWVAPAISLTLTSWGMVWLLARGARSMGDVARFDARLRRRLWRICAASAVMGLVLWASNVALTPFLGMPNVRYGALFLLIGIGGVVYFGAAQLFGAISLRELKGSMRRNRS